MNLEDSIGYGHMSIGELTELVRNNIYDAREMQLRLRWRFVPDGICGEIFSNGKTVYQKEFTGKYTHVHLAEMHADWRRFLQEEDRRRKAVIRKAQQEAAREERELARRSIGERIEFVKGLGKEVG